MVPAAYVLLDSMPLSPNGKLDRKALPAPGDTAYAVRAYEAPVGEVECAIAQIWSEVLGIERIGRHDNFFELGGHSLLAVKVRERMGQHGLHTDIRAFFSSPSLAALAEAVGDATGAVGVPENKIPADTSRITPEMLSLASLSQDEIDRIVATVPEGAANIQDIYPLAPLQEGILFHHLLMERGDPYLLLNNFSFADRSRLDAYIASFRFVISRHDILRTSFAWEGLPDPVQIVWRNAALVVEEVELDPSAGDIAEQLRSRFDPRHYRLDISQAPLIRLFVAYDKAHDRWVSLDLLHHLISDHVTMEIMRGEMFAHLEGRAASLAAPLPFRNFVAQSRLGVSRQEHEAFFREMLGDVGEPTAPFGLIDTQGDGTEIKEAYHGLAGDLSRRLRERSRLLGVSTASLCHVAWARVLSRASGRDDVVFGTVLFGRMEGGKGSDRALGLFINTLPIRIKTNIGLEEGIRQTHALLTQLMHHEHAPLSLAQQCSNMPAQMPLFSALLNYRHSARVASDKKSALNSDLGIKFIGGEERTNYPLALSVNDLGEELSLSVQASPS
ncbi:MAG TPA: condensation domain-containing protein, partial [Bryobacteraceae bacterium]